MRKTAAFLLFVQNRQDLNSGLGDSINRLYNTNHDQRQWRFQAGWDRLIEMYSVVSTYAEDRGFASEEPPAFQAENRTYCDSNPAQPILGSLEII